MKFRFALLAVAALALSGCDTLKAIENAAGLPDTSAQTNASIKAEAAASASTPTAAQPSAASSTPVPSIEAATGAAAGVPSNAEKIVFDIRAGYDAVFLAPAAHYRQLAICGSPGAGTICAKKDVIVQLQKADKAAEAALDAAEAIARGKQQGAFAKAMAAASAAIAAAEKIVAAYNITL